MSPLSFLITSLTFILTKISAPAFFASFAFSPNNLDSKVIPYEQGGLPTPFMTRLVDDTGNSTPDRAFISFVGPGFAGGYVRKPTQREIDWYRSQ
ncbi:MAG: hypothetical protein IIC15_05670 [Thaumarchaeota archaeon]|nr:hypothetical protein [Nitrososphaerota archaeon]